MLGASFLHSQIQKFRQGAAPPGPPFQLLSWFDFTNEESATRKISCHLPLALGPWPWWLGYGAWSLSPHSPVPMEPEPWSSLQPWATSVFRAMCLSVSLGHTHTRKHKLFCGKQGQCVVGLESWGPSIFCLKWLTLEILNTLEFVSRDRLLAESATFLY